jgi:hypothetical protein
MNLDEYLASTDRNAFWRLDSGDHQNLLDEAIDRIGDLEQIINADGTLDSHNAICDEARDAMAVKAKSAELVAEIERLRAMRAKVVEANARFGHFAGMFGGDTSHHPTSAAVLLADLAKRVHVAAKVAEERDDE